MKKFLLVLFAIVLVFGVVFSGCGTSTTTTVTAPPVTATTTAPPVTATTTAPPVTTTVVPPPDRYGGTLQILMTSTAVTPIGYPPEADWNSLDLVIPCVEPLVKYRDKTVPWLAESWEIAADGKSITFKLQKNVKFHDGSDFNAEVAEWNLENTIAAEKIPSAISVDIIDDYTIRMNLESWNNFIFTNMERYSEMVSKEAFDKNGIEWSRWHPVGTGPFKFVEYERDARAYFERNDDYWQEGLPYLDAIEYVNITDETVRKIAFQNGEIHAMRASGSVARELLTAAYPYNTIAGGTFLLIPDSANPDSPFADKNVRLAASHALDREALASAMGFGFARPAYQLYPGYEVAAIPDLDKHEYDQDKAKQLLADAGYPDGFPTTLHKFIIVPEDYLHACANMLTEVGITTTVALDEPGLYAQYRFDGWDDGLMGHGMASGSNLNQWLKAYLGGLQFPSLQRAPGFLEALDASITAPDIDPAYIQAVIKIVHDNVMVIPYLEEVPTSFTQQGVHDTGFLNWELSTWTPELCWLEPDLR